MKDYEYYNYGAQKDENEAGTPQGDYGRAQMTEAQEMTRNTSQDEAPAGPTQSVYRYKGAYGQSRSPESQEGYGQQTQSQAYGQQANRTAGGQAYGQQAQNPYGRQAQGPYAQPGQNPYASRGVYHTQPDYAQRQSQPKAKASGGFGKKVAKVAAMGLAFGLAGGLAFNGVNYVSNRVIDIPAKEIPSTGRLEEAPKAAEGSTGGTVGKTAVSNATAVNDVADIAANVMPSIVQVSVMTVTEYRNWFGQVGEYESEGAGSGILIDQDKDYLYIATNNHVVSGAKELTITFNDDQAVKAEILGADARTDLAVVRVKISDVPQETMDHIKVATMGSSKDLAVGSSVVVIGNALGYGQSVTTGVISALERDVELMGDDGTPISNRLIQTDAAVNPGNSGGALLNMNGEVIGVVSAKYADTEVEGMGYAIPISDASDIISSLVKGEDLSAKLAGNGAYLGIAGVDVNKQTAAQYNMPTGVYVSQTMDGGGAATAGIQKGDVITAFDGKPISSMRELQETIAERFPGDAVKVTIQREGIMGYTEMEADVTLTKAPDKQKQQKD